MRVIDCQQNTPEWHAARCGRVTASRVCDIVRKVKTGVSKMRRTYAGELIAERLAGVQHGDGFVSQAMQFGKDMEDRAALTYAFMRDASVEKIGFVEHPTIEMAGASPDRLVGDDGLLQIKVPNTSTHLDSLRGAEIDPDYLKQIQWEMACTGRLWCDYCSFDPRLPEAMQLHVQRVARCGTAIKELEEQVTIFLAEIEAEVAELTSRFGLKEAA